MNTSREIGIVQIERNKFLEELSNKERLIADLEKRLSNYFDQINLHKKAEELNKMKIDDLIKELEQVKNKLKYCEDEFKAQAIN